MKKRWFFCQTCGRTFVSTTNTIMSNFHFSAFVWKEMIADNFHSNAIDYSVKRLGIHHQSTLDMRHKILLALHSRKPQASVWEKYLSLTEPLDCYKSHKPDSSVTRAVCRHGAKAEKSSISNEYVCICTGIQREGEDIVATINSATEFISIYDGHIADETFALCDRLGSYHASPRIEDCTVKDCGKRDGEISCFYHPNTVNGFHRLIK